MQSLLSLPPPISFFIVSAITTSFALFGVHLVRKKYSADVLKENHEVAAIIFNALGLLYGVVVAFVVFVTWSGYDDATKNLQLEASDTIDLFYSATAFAEPVGKVVQRGLMDYADSVYRDEVNRMSTQDISIQPGSPLRKLLHVFN